MRSDVRKTLKDNYAFSVAMDEPDYYITPEYRQYRETLARFYQDKVRLDDFYEAVHLAFPGFPLDYNMNLVDNPGFQFYYKPQGMAELFAPPELEPGDKIYSFVIHISGLGPFWHMQVDSTECIDKDECEDFLESKIPPIFAREHKQLAKNMQELGYRELTSAEAWEKVKNFNHHLIPEECVRTGHLLFDVHSSFGVENFEEIMLGLNGLFDELMENFPLPGLEDLEKEPWLDDSDQENELFYEPPPDEPEKPQTLH